MGEMSFEQMLRSLTGENQRLCRIGHAKRVRKRHLQPLIIVAQIKSILEQQKVLQKYNTVEEEKYTCTFSDELLFNKFHLDK